MKWEAVEKGLLSGLKWSDKRPGEASLDPYLVWAELDGLKALGSPEFLTLMVEVDRTCGGSGLDEAVTFAASAAQSGKALRVMAFKDISYFSIDLTIDRINPVLVYFQRCFKRVELGTPIVQRQAPPGGFPFLPRNIGVNARVVGIIDDGIAFANHRFRFPGPVETGGTRVAFFWNQDSRATGAGSTADFGYGWEIDKADIDKAILEVGSEPETAIYEKLGYDAVKRRNTHGTGVLDIAAGADNCSRPWIIAVQLPNNVISDTSAIGLAPHVRDGVHYILERASFLSQQHLALPVVINLSYASSRGRRNGSSMLECAMAELVALSKTTSTPLSIVVPTGNQRMSRGHARLPLPAGGAPGVLHWRILPLDRTPSFLEIWCDEGADLKVSVRPPGGWAGSAVKAAQVQALVDDAGGLAAAVIYLDRVANGDGTMVLVAVSPTAAFDDRTLAPAGVWEIEVSNEAGTSVMVDAWIQRDDSIEGNPRAGRQSFFEDPADIAAEVFVARDDEAEPMGYVRRSGTVNGFGTSDLPVTVAGYREADGTMAPYSGSGVPQGGKPDAAAVSDRSVVLSGVLTSGSQSGSTVAINGTSVAVPQVVRRLWQHHKGLSGEDAATFVREAARESEKDAPAGWSPQHPAERAGDGRLRVMAPWNTGRRPPQD